MKKRTLPLLLAAAIAPSALAAITLNGAEISDLNIKNVGGNVVITTSPANPTDPTDPTDPTQPTDPTDPTDPTQPTDPTDPTEPTGPCGNTGQELVFETLKWNKFPGQTVVDIPKTTARSSKFTTTSSRSYSGNITLVPTVGTGYVTRRMWISSCPGGAPVAQAYNGCDVSGTEASLRWSQEVSPRSRTACKLDPNTTYYLNYSNAGCNAASCDAFRNTYYVGSP